MKKQILLLLILLSIFSCARGNNKSNNESPANEHNQVQENTSIKVGAEITEAYFTLIEGKRVAVMTN